MKGRKIPASNKAKPAPASRNRRARALVVSLTNVDPKKYDGWDGRAGCTGCGIDAARISDTLRLADFEIVQLADGAAKASAVLKALKKAAVATKPGETFFFYYSGHGGQMPDINSDEDEERGGRPGSDETLVCYDAELIDDELDKVWLSFPKGSVVYMVSDSCNSGTNYRNILTQGASPIRPLPRAVAKKMKARLLHIGGCRDGFSSFGMDDGGVMTKALVKTWNGGRGPGTWKTLFESTCQRITGQLPQLNTYGPHAADLATARPFTAWVPSAPKPPTSTRAARSAGTRSLERNRELSPALAAGETTPTLLIPDSEAGPASRSLESRALDLPIGQDAARKVTRWLMTHFGEKIRAAGAGTPFGPEILCAIVCQETAYFWLPILNDLERKPEFRDRPAELAEYVLSRCVLDGSGDVPGSSRGAFPKNTQAFRDRYGAEFTNMLIEEANETRALRGFGPKQWVYKGYGIFQYDLQSVEEDEDFFRDKQWYFFDASLGKCIGELKQKLRNVGGDLWEAVRAYNGAGPRARAYRDNVKAFTTWTKDEIGRMPASAPRSAPAIDTGTRGIMPPARPQLTQAGLAEKLASFDLDRATHPLVLVGIRGYFTNTMGQPGVNDRGMYDDAIFVDAPDGFAAFNANTDPSKVREGSGFGSGKGMARLKPGAYFAHKFDPHCSVSTGICHDAICQRLGDVTVIRDGKNDADYEDTGKFGINIHRGGQHGTSSEGCQTLHPDQWTSFYAFAKDLAKRYYGAQWNKKVVPYVLLES